jgi:putative transposase
MVIAAAELRKRSQDHSREFQVTARRLANFVASAEAQESLLVQRLQDAAARNIRLVKERSTSEFLQDLAPPNEGDSLAEPEEAVQPAVAATALPPPEVYEEY